jgi:hypothetical protein
MNLALLRRLAPGLALVIFAAPVFLFLLGDLVIFLTVVAPRRGVSPQDTSSLAGEVVFCIFAGLLFAYGARMIRRRLKAQP